MGRERVKKRAPMRPPINEDKKAALKALAAWPCLAREWPSSTVAAAAADPGVPINTEVMVSEV